MESPNTNSYPINNKVNEIFGNYARNQCAQQSTSQRHFLPPYAMAMSNNMPHQSIMYNTHQNQSVYNIMYPHQSVYRSESTYTTNYSQSMDWTEPCIKNNDYRKKENCCVENVPLDVYKTKNIYNYNKNTLLDPSWYYGNSDNQKYSELPSCSQISSDNTIGNCCNMKDINVNSKSVKYCSIQKLPETDSKLLGYSKQYENTTYLNQYNKLTKDYSSCSQPTQTCNLYSGSTCLEIDKKILIDQCEIQSTCDILSNQYFSQTDNTLQTYIEEPKINEKADESNCNGAESDIVVEDSDDESDDSEDNEKETHSCAVCQSSIANQFYDITSELTLTTFSHTRVSEKIFQVLGWISHASKNLCDECMNLLNSYDQLEVQLDGVRQKLLNKHKIEIKLPDKENNKIMLDIVTETKETNKKYKRTKFESSFRCKRCRKTFSFVKFYKYHILTHKQKKSFLCELCGCKFLSRLKLKLHSKTHNKKCKKCLKTISNNSTHFCSNDKMFMCHLCGKTFKTKINLREHENLCSGESPFKCLECNKQYPSLSKLNNHNKLLHEQLYSNTCQKCGKGFVKNSDYKTHLISHSNEKKFMCVKCGNIYKSLSNLNQHKKIHNAKMPFNCTVCNKGFLRKENLESHLNNHNGVKPFPCTLCEKEFVSQKNLDAHLKVHNGTLKKKICNICGKQLIHGLKEHMRIHSNLKTFVCNECSMKFLTKGALAKHTKRKHENKEYDILQM